jgi:hypothetical protein
MIIILWCLEAMKGASLEKNSLAEKSGESSNADLAAMGEEREQCARLLRVHPLFPILEVSDFSLL